MTKEKYVCYGCACLCKIRLENIYKLTKFNCLCSNSKPGLSKWVKCKK